MNRVPYILVVGEREARQGNVSVRKRGSGDLGAVALEEFIKQAKQEIDSKTI